MYHNVTAMADYVVSWVECGRDVHGFDISVLGLCVIGDIYPFFITLPSALADRWFSTTMSARHHPGHHPGNLDCPSYPVSTTPDPDSFWGYDSVKFGTPMPNYAPCGACNIHQAVVMGDQSLAAISVNAVQSCTDHGGLRGARYRHLGRGLPRHGIQARALAPRRIRSPCSRRPCP